MYELIAERPTILKCPECGAELMEIEMRGYMGPVFKSRGECGFECNITGFILLKKCKIGDVKK